MVYHQCGLRCWAATICRTWFHHKVCTFHFYCHNDLCHWSRTTFPQPCVETSQSPSESCLWQRSSICKRNSPRNSTGYLELGWQPPLPTTLRDMHRWNGSTRNWNNISNSSPTKDKLIGWGSCHSQNSSITTRFILPLNTLLSSLTLDVFLGWALNRTNLGPVWNPSMSSKTRWKTPWRKQRWLWPSQKTTWRSTTIGNGPRLWSSKQTIWSSSTPATFRPLDLQRSFLTKDWDRSQSIVRWVMVCTDSAFLCWWVNFIPSSTWSNYLWLLQTPFLADGHLHLLYWKLWMVKRSGWWRKSWIVGWSTGGFVTWSSGRVLVLSTIPGNLGIMFMHWNWWRLFTGGTLMLLVISVQSTSTPFLSVQCQDITALKGGGGWMLEDAPLHPTFPPIFLRHLCTSLLIIASPRWSALAAPIAESDGHVT